MDDDDAIAIVGLGCKFPGADNQDEFWKVLVNGENHVNEIPPERWNIDAFYSSDPNTAGKTYVRRAGLLKNHDGFDNKLFNISEIEAERMDPQQRYVLECVHMALEDGGITRNVINGSDTGVFIGFMNDDYKESSSDDLTAATNYSLTGASPSIIAARVSYVYNLLGPSMAIDTACSSALVAIDVAIQNIITGRCSMVVCGGVNSILTPDIFIPLSRARMVSPTGQCQAFSDKADGYARGEGCGIVILKKLRDAKRDRNKIWATIATDCNQDGHTATPITAPSGSQQENLLHRIYSSKNVNPQDVQVIEAHGTGTPVGDPIEANTLGRFFGRDTKDESQYEQVYIASVKTNIGHLESAAGVAGLIKVLLMMKNQIIVPSLHFTRSNVNIDFERYGFVVPTSTIPWKSNGTVGRLACANSFGFGGTNSHAIINEYSGTEDTKQIHTSSRNQLIFISAVDLVGLQMSFSKFSRQIETTKSKLSDISYTSLCRRDHYQNRVAVVATNLHDLKNKCLKRERLGFKASKVRLKDPHIVAVFCGVGTNWNGMCSQLLQNEPIVENTIHKIDNIISKWIDWSVFEFLSNSQDSSDPVMAHITIFTCQVALWCLWEHWGIKIDAIVGQSVGEVAAAYAAGCLTLEQAIEVIFRRSSILANATGGRMFVVGNCQTKHIEAVCKQFQGKACIAVYSSSSSCTVSCDSDVINELKLKIKEGLPIDETQNIFVRDLNVQCAYHSHHTEDAGNQLEQSLCHLQGGIPSIPIVSTVSGRKASGNDYTDPSYWKLNVSRPVLFKDAVLCAGSSKAFNIFLEIGPKPVLRAHLRDSYSDTDAVCLPSMKQSSESDTLFDTIAELFEHGVTLDWNKVYKGDGTLNNLPSYVLHPTRRLYLADSTRLKSQGLKQSSGSHLFVGRTPSDVFLFRVNINEAVTPFVFEHFVSNTIIVPGAFYVEVALEVAQSLSKQRTQDVAVKLDFIRPIVLSKGKSYSASVMIRDSKSNEPNCVIQKDKDIIAKFSFKSKLGCFCHDGIDLDVIRQKCCEFQAADKTYATLRKLGFTYGNDLKILGDAFKNANQCIVKMHVSCTIWDDIKTTHLHPSILDGLLQTPGVLQTESADDKTLLPAGIGELRLRRGPERDMIGYAEIKHRSENEILYNMLLLTVDGGIIAEVNDFKIKYVNDSSVNNSLEYAIAWEEIEVNPKANGSNSKSQKILVCSFNSSFLTSMTGTFEDNEVSCYLLNQQNSLETQKNIIHSKLQCDPCITHICFVPGLTLDGLAPGVTVLEAIRSSCVVMLALVQSLTSNTRDIPVIVITENTQVRDNENFTLFNIFGSELWGQVRSILREHDSLDICLLDCQPSAVSALGFIVQFFINRGSYNYSELMFTDGRLFTNKLSQSSDRQKQPTFRSAGIDECINVEIKTKNANDLRETFCVLQSSDNIISKNNTTLIAAQNVCLHKPVLYPTTLPEVSNRVSALPGSNENGYSVLTFEIIANVINDPIRYLTSGSSKREPKMVVACFPMKVQSIVSVPSSCVYPLSNLPGYKPGMQLVAILMRSLVDYVKNGESVHILCDKEDILPGHILQLMLKNSRNCSVRILTEHATNSPASKLIPLKRCEISEMNTFIQWGSITSILSLSAFIGQDMRIMLETHDIEVISVQTEDILCKRNLMRLNPAVFKFVSKHIGVLSSLNPDKTHYESIIPIPCQTFSLTFENIKKYNSVKIPSNMPFRRDGCYIVIGGLTGLGWEIVNLLAIHHAGEVISLSRREIDIHKQKALKSLSDKTGCQIRTFSTDITNFDVLQKTFQQIEQSSTRKIKGIFQGAGVLRDTFSTRMNEIQLLDVLKPKVLGTWNLHLATQKYSLDYFVMHSSMTSVMGNIGQSNYGGANAFMDGLAYYRRLNGFCGQSINWGPLAVGMAKDDANTEQILQKQGYFLLEVSAISECLLTTLHCNHIQVTFGKFDWNLIWRSMSAMNNDLVQQRFSSLLLHDKNGSRTLDEHASSDELIDIMQAPATERVSKIKGIVLRTASEAFTIDIEILSKETCIQDLGIDSMQSMTFSNRLHELTGIRISIVTLMSDETTFGTVIDMLNENITEMTGKSQPDQLIDSSIQNGMTQMEKKSYDAYHFNQNDPSLFIFVDLSVSHDLADPSIWKHIMKQVQIKHGALRTVFMPDQDGVRYGVRKHVINSTDAVIDFLIVSMQELDHEGKIPTDLTHYLFDPSTDFPMRILFANENNKCIVRFVFNHLSLDLTSIWTVVNDIVAMNNSTESSIQPDIDIAVIYEQKLQAQKKELVRYWKENTPTSLQPMSFKSATDAVLDPTFFSFTKLSIDRDIIVNLTKFFSSQNLKLFDFIVSLYQLLLHAELEQDTITVFATVDMRIHFPELKNRICRFINQVPLYVKLGNKTNVASFMKNNKQSLAGAIENSLLPFDAISEFVQNIEPRNVFRHQVIMEQVETSSYYDNMVNIKRVSTGNYYNETVLYVWHDLEHNYLELELAYSTLMIDKARAINCLNRVLHFIQCIVNNPDVTINSLTSNRVEGGNSNTGSNRSNRRSNVGQSNPDLPETIFNRHQFNVEENKLDESSTNVNKHIGTMQKQTLRGWSHSVFVSIRKTKSEKFLQWGTNKNKLLRMLPLENVKKVEMLDMNDKYSLLIHALDRVYTFKTSDYSVVSKFINFLSTEDGKSEFSTLSENDSALF